MQPDATEVKALRCAIYTRKSTDDGLEQDFNSLDAQRECAEAYILSQRHAKWTVRTEHYDDGGFTGANLDRPALKQLLADIEAGLIDCVVVYKVDRLSRSLLDFARIMEVFDKRNISFVSVTQQLNTTSPMGRLTLNVLLSFAQFEREIISERTRDKMMAARRRGKWTGGTPSLGYDCDPVTRKLIVNEAEAAQIRTIFKVFLKTRSLMDTLEEIDRRGWKTKGWTTQKSKQRSGARFDRPSLIRVLTNVLYIGEVRSGAVRYPGEQPAIIEPQIWEQASKILDSRKRGPGRERKRHSPFLEQRLKCGVCGKSMVQGHTTKAGRRYRYYLCQTARAGGIKMCPGQTIPARRIEHAVRAKLLELADSTSWPKLTAALRLHPAEWETLATRHQHTVLDQVVESVSYDHRSEQAALRMKPEICAGDSATVTVIVRKDPSGRRHSVPPNPREEPRAPRLARVMALAFLFEKHLVEGNVKNYPELARRAGVSLARISQILKLRNLAPAIQQQLVFLSSSHTYLSELDLRRISQQMDWQQQLQQFNRLVARSRKA